MFSSSYSVRYLQTIRILYLSWFPIISCVNRILNNGTITSVEGDPIECQTTATINARWMCNDNENNSETEIIDTTDAENKWRRFELKTFTESFGK